MTRPARHPGAGLGILASVVLACSVLVLARPGVSDLSTQPADTASSPTSTTQVDRPHIEPPWYLIGTGDHRFSARAIAAHEGRFVVVGDSSDFEDEGPAVYWSDNGVDWHAPRPGTGPDSINVTDVIAVRDGFLAVGVGQEGPGAWRSADGQTWVKSPVVTSRGPRGVTLWGITGTRLGYFAWGFHGRRANLWRSADGKAWTPVADETVFDLPRQETICAVREVEGHLMATGVAAPAGTRKGHRVSWTSADGDTWVLAEAGGSRTFWCDPTNELGHWQARNEAGLVRIEPYGPGDAVEFTPTRP